MCGIAGIIGDVSPGNREAVGRMTDAIAHRGPDGVGYWNSAPDSRGRGCMFGHRRLSILDLSRAGDQPMTDCTRGHEHTIVFNGEIYNFQDLRRDLESNDQSFRSTGDTAVMLRLLALEGPGAVRKLRGMFAFALWDHRAQQLTLARDPLGIKPLYVAHNPDPDGEWSLMFSSELRSILAANLLDRPRLDRRALASVIWNGFVVGPGTVVEGIESIRPGELRVVDSTGQVTQAERYWRMPGADRKGELGEAELRDELAESVRLHLVSDVPLGIFLSGGIDSSAVANLAQKASNAPVHTFTLSFEEKQYDEGEYARQIAHAIGTEHHEITLTGQEVAANVNAAIETLDQPTFDGLNSYYISKAVRDAGLKVALVGTGGDELFGGYPSFRMLPAMLRWEQRTRFIPMRAKLPVARLASKLLSGGSATMPPQTRWAKLPDMVRSGDDVIGAYQIASALFLPEFQHQLLVDGDHADAIDAGLGPDMAERLSGEIAGHSPLTAISVLEQRLFLGERLLRDTDAASMAVSLETRLPLVDHRLTEVVNRLSDDDRYLPTGRKSILRNVGLAGLNPALFERPKRGFELPFERWIRRSLGQMMIETMLDASLSRAVGLNGSTVARLWSAFQEGAPGLYWSRVWMLYVLIRWCHRYQVLV